MNILEQINVILPDSDDAFRQKLTGVLSTVARIQNTTLHFSPTKNDYFPKIAVSFDQVSVPLVTFIHTDKSTITVELTNKTNHRRISPERYRQITIDDFISRITTFQIENVDHIGFDIPWFDGIHPDILQLRKQLIQGSLYYLFPTGELWDFILPGTIDEIQHTGDPNLSMVRRPKFEIVSINKTSTPIIQIEINVNKTFAEIVQFFPEGIAVPEVKNVWVYLENDFGVDVCLVLNESSKNDWSNFFQGKRLQGLP